MNPLHLIKTAARKLLGLLALALTYNERRKLSLQHVERLAAEIIEVAESIDVDLDGVPVNSDLAGLSAQSAKCRKQAQQASGVRWVSSDALEQAVGDLHEGHRRIVNLRSELDALLAARRGGKDHVRYCKFATGSKPVRSRWSSTGSHPKPTTSFH